MATCTWIEIKTSPFYGVQCRGYWPRLRVEVREEDSCVHVDWTHCPWCGQEIEWRKIEQWEASE